MRSALHVTFNCPIVDAIIKQNNMFSIGSNDDDLIYVFVWKIIEALIVELSKREAFLTLAVGILNEDNSDIYTLLQVINDLLDPVGQNLRVREDAQVQTLLESIIGIFVFNHKFRVCF